MFVTDTACAGRCWDWSNRNLGPNLANARGNTKRFMVPFLVRRDILSYVLQLRTALFLFPFFLFCLFRFNSRVLDNAILGPGAGSTSGTMK